MMYKPKNISIKKMTNQPSQQKRKEKLRNSSTQNIKSLSTKQYTNPQQIMNTNTFEDEEQIISDHSETYQTDFIAYINQYLDSLDSDNLSKTNFFQKIKGKIKRQKQINLNLQKNVIEIQKILWQRNKKIDEIEDNLKIFQQNFKSKKSACFIDPSKRKNIKKNSLNYKVEDKENYNFNHNDRKIQNIFHQLKQFQSQESQYSDIFDIEKQHKVNYGKRRKTQVPSEIEKMVSKTMGVRVKKNGVWDI